MAKIIFTAISPHPPIILPSVGSSQDRTQVKKTIKALEKLGEKLKELNPQKIIISSPHPDWGFNVPLFFLTKDFQGEIKKILIGPESPAFNFEKGKKISQELANLNERYALIASGDLSHCLKEEGPYGFHSDGPKFDRELIESLKKKEIKTILKLNEKYPQAGECGLGSLSFVLGILEFLKINYQPEILSYQFPFGVGYLVVNFKMN